MSHRDSQRSTCVRPFCIAAMLCACLQRAAECPAGTQQPSQSLDKNDDAGCRRLQCAGGTSRSLRVPSACFTGHAAGAGQSAGSSADEGDPSFRPVWVCVAKGAGGLTKCLARFGRMESQPLARGGNKVLVYLPREVAGVLIGHRPQRGDDVAAARDAQGRADGDGLVGIRR